MSLLDRGPHTLLVQPMQPVKDRYRANAYVPAGPPVKVRGAVQPVTADEAYSLGVQASTTYKVICRSWPGGLHSQVTWDGRKWGQHGEARKHSTGRRTSHQTVVITATTAEAK